MLDRAYGFSRERIAKLLADLVGTAKLHVEAPDDVIRAAEGYRRGGAGFSERMVAAAARRSGVFQEGEMLDRTRWGRNDFGPLGGTAIRSSNPLMSIFFDYHSS